MKQQERRNKQITGGLEEGTRQENTDSNKEK
jgi:hypothetical protein